MKYIKYIAYMILLMIFEINIINAETCFYQTGEISLEYDSNRNKFTIRQRNDSKDFTADNESLINKNDSFNDGFTKMRVDKISTGCPNYIVYRRKERKVWVASDGIWGFDNSSDAEKFKNASKEINNMYVWSSPKTSVTREEFENNIERNITSAVNNSNQIYGVNGLETSDKVMNCEELFDSSIIKLINDILKYPRYIVPGIIIVLGTLDFFKAVIAGKEDEMKKAQKTFIKRVIIGVCVFLVPVLINTIIWLANIAWQGLGYSTCSL